MGHGRRLRHVKGVDDSRIRKIDAGVQEDWSKGSTEKRSG
jgi:hypothetical protein